jgi:hypothetical protein
MKGEGSGMKKNFSLKPLLGIMLLSATVTGLPGCEELGKLVQPNEPPVVDRLFAWRDRLLPADTTTVKVEARDPEGGVLSYEWSAEPQTLSSTTGPQVIWTAPFTAGNHKISVKVKDDKGKETEASITLAVISLERPTVKITKPANGEFIPGVGTITIEAIATHLNGIQRVEFRVGNNMLGVDNFPPYQQSWRVEGLFGPATVIATAFRAGTPGEPGVDSVRVSIEGVTRL